MADEFGAADASRQERQGALAAQGGGWGGSFPAANLPGTRRSAPKRRLARVLDRDALREKLDVTGTVKTAVHRALGL